MSLSLGRTAIREKAPPERKPREYVKAWHAMLEPCIVTRLYYTTATGNSWKGLIEKATFRVRTGGVSYWMRCRSDMFFAAVDPPRGSSRPQQQKMMKAGLTYLMQSPGDWKYDAENGFATWRMRNYTPSEPICFSWLRTSLPQTADECPAMVRRLLGPHPKAADVLELCEIVAAFHGIVPKTDSVKRFVEHQVWYHPVNGRRRSELTQEHRETLSRLEAIAKTECERNTSSG